MNKNLSGHLGFQTMVELYGCDFDLINDEKKVEDVLLKMTKLVGLTVVQSVIHHFSPIGVSGVVVIEESHVAIHTWPEHKYVAVDFFTCNEQYDISEGIAYLKEHFKAEKVELNSVKRGAIEMILKMKNK